MGVKYFLIFKRGIMLSPSTLLLLALVMTLEDGSLKAGGLESMFEKLGARANQTGAGSFQDQATGHYTAGGLFVRQQTKTLQPIHIRLPHFGGSCDGMSLQFGGLSFITGQEAVQMLKRVAQGVPTYALQLALKTMAPQVEGLMSQLRNYVQTINNTLFDECTMKQAIMDAVLPKQGAFREQLCMDMSKQGHNQDVFSSKKACDEQGHQQEALERAREKYEDLMAGEYNLVWHVLKKMPQYQDNKDLAEFIMTLTGTLISHKEEESYRIVYLSPKADEKEFLTAYLKGGDTLQFSCDTSEACLHPTQNKTVISEEDAMEGKVMNRILDLRQKYMEFGTITDDEKSFLGDAVKVPLYRYIQISVAVGSPFMMNDTAEFIALSVLLHQFETIASEILQAVELLEGVQMEASTIKEFKDRLQLARNRLNAMMGASDHQAIWRLTEWMKTHEQAILAKNS